MKKQTLDERLELYVADKVSKDASPNALLLAASAVAGVGAILVPPPAEAAIVYSGVQNDEVKNGSDTQTVDFDNDGVEDFNFLFYTSGDTNYQVVENATGSLKVVGSPDLPKRLAKDEDISGDNFLTTSIGVLAVEDGSGDFLDTTNGGYLGVKLEINSNTHYGWIQYKANSDASVGTIIDWAYEDTPDKAIKTGATVSIDDDFDWNLFLPAILAGAKK